MLARGRARTAASSRRILIWALEHDYIDAALVCYLEGDGTIVEGRSPAWPATRDEVLATAGSRYTYSANTMAYAEAIEGGAERWPWSA